MIEKSITVVVSTPDRFEDKASFKVHIPTHMSHQDRIEGIELMIHTLQRALKKEIDNE